MGSDLILPDEARIRSRHEAERAVPDDAGHRRCWIDRGVLFGVVDGLRADLRTTCETEAVVRKQRDELRAENARLREECVSKEFVLSQLAGMRFPEQGQAYDFMRDALEGNST